MKIEGAQVVADRDDQAGSLDGGRQPDRAGRVVGGQRLLGQERDAELDQPLADGHRPVRRNAHVDDVGPGRLHHSVEVIEGRAAPRAGQGRRRPASVREVTPTSSRPPEPLERLEVQPGDPARPHQAEPDGQSSPPKILASSNGAVSSSWS